MVQDMSGGEERPIEPLQGGETVSRRVEIDGPSSVSNEPTDRGPAGDESRIDPPSEIAPRIGADPASLDDSAPNARSAAVSTISDLNGGVDSIVGDVSGVASTPIPAALDVGASTDVTADAVVEASKRTPPAQVSSDSESVLSANSSTTPGPDLGGDRHIERPRTIGAGTPHREIPPSVAPARPHDSVGLFHLPTLHHFTSSFGVERVLEQLVEKSLRQNRRLDHVLLHGGTGSGTTLVARALVRDLAPSHCVELDVLDGFDPSTLSSAIREVRDGGVLLIRHIEVLDGAGERMLMDCIARRNTLGTGRFAPTDGAPRHRRNTKPRLDEVDNIGRKGKPGWRPRAANFTLVATAHMTQPIGYQLRCRFDHMIHLRKDPTGTRLAICRAVAREGVRIDVDAHPLIERFVDTIGDSAEQLAQAIIARAELEGIIGAPQGGTGKHGSGDTKGMLGKTSPAIVASSGARDATGTDDACAESRSRREKPRPDGRTVTRGLMHSIIVRDMPCRLPDEVYAHALTLHLAGRRVHRMTDAEVSRIDLETGWGETVVRAALVLMLRAQQMRSTRPAA